MQKTIRLLSTGFWMVRDCLRIYSVSLCEFKQVLQTSAKRTRSTDEQKRWKRRNSSGQDSKKKAATSPAPYHKAQVPTKNVFAPFRMETGNEVAERHGQEVPTSKAGRPLRPLYWPSLLISWACRRNWKYY
jgi:hypothetical protein